ncbi:lipopolysaccharide kinase InaA family protein [Streptomyces sp. NPDC004610]|uniref:lipopolysaccharide kinase InaA family protein n=1 Tax=unclassified Streptomyces TaxID=2593676 RepID=UPI0033AF4417
MTDSHHHTTTAHRLTARLWGEEATARLVADRRGTCLWRVQARSGPYALKITVPCADPQGHVDSGRLALVEAGLLTAMGPVAPPGLYQDHGLLPGGPAAGSWLALRWVDGDDAETAFAKLRPCPDRTAAAAYAAAMSEAVADLHAGGWRHGDLQEAHFILDSTSTSTRRAHLLDFAMAHPPTAPRAPDP